MRIRLLGTLLTLSSLCWSQGLFMGQNQPGVVASGGQFTETFGNWNNPAGSCGTSMGSGCQNLWTVGGGTAQSVVTCPGTVTWATSGGAKCLRMTEVAATAGYIYSYGTFTPVPASTTADYFFYVYVTAHTIANFDIEPILCISFDINCGTLVAKVAWAPTGGNLQIEGQGSTGSARSGTVTLNAWHKIQLHIDATAANCNTFLDGVATGTFTCNANQGNYVIIGDPTGNLDAVTENFGRIWGNSTVNGGFPPSTLTTAGSNTNGTNITTTTIKNDTSGGNGTWAFSTGVSGTALTYSNAKTLYYPIPVTINNIQKNPNNTGTVSYFYDPSKTANGITYTFLSPYTACSAKFKWSYTLTDTTNDYTMGNTGETSATDPFGWHFRSGAVYLNDPTGTVNTSNGASGGCSSNCVTSTAGQPFTVGTYWNGVGITINAVGFTVSSVIDGTHLQLTTAPGTQTGVTYTLTTRQTIALVNNTDYWLSYQMNKGGPYNLQVFDSTGTTLIGSLSRNTSSNGSCTSMCIGRGCGGDTAFTGAGGFYFNNFVLDYVQARWPQP